MPNIAAALKQEIARVARRQVKSETDALKKTISGYRAQIAALKRRVEQLERQVKRGASVTSAASPEAQDDGDAQHRWRAAGFAQHRKRLGLSAAQMGRLLGVSALSVYKWESGTVRPRSQYLPAIAMLRTMGKREAAKRLEQQA